MRTSIAVFVCLALMAGMLIQVSRPVSAQPELDVPPPPPGPAEGRRGAAGMQLMMWGGLGQERDTELAQLTMDIMLLRQINQIALSADQIKQMIPLLQQLVDGEKELKKTTKQLLLDERKQLLRGEADKDQLRQARTKMREMAEQFRDRTEKVMGQTAQVLTPEQAEKMKALVMGQPRPKMNQQRQQKGQEGQGFVPQGEGGQGERMKERMQERMGQQERRAPGPRSVIVGRVLELLKEKLKVMGQRV